MSFNNTPPGRGTRLFGFLHSIKSPAFVPFRSFSGDSSASVCSCSPLPHCTSSLFQARLTRLNGPNRLLDHITFPRRAGFGVSEQIRLTPNAKQFMQQASIAEVNLRRFYLPLLQVGVPRWELTDHEDVRENVEIAANSIFRKA